MNKPLLTSFYFFLIFLSLTTVSATKITFSDVYFSNQKLDCYNANNTRFALITINNSNINFGNNSDYFCTLIPTKSALMNDPLSAFDLMWNMFDMLFPTLLVFVIIGVGILLLRKVIGR